MDKDALTGWALANGWTMVAGMPSLTKPSKPAGPSKPAEAIVRMVFKATVVNVEVRKPAGKWEKVSGAAYGAVEADPEGGMPSGLGFERIPSFSMLMRDNKDRQVFARMK